MHTFMIKEAIWHKVHYNPDFIQELPNIKFKAYYAGRRNGPEKLLGEFEQLILLRLLFAYPGIYLHELQDKLNTYGVITSVPSICRTLRQMGLTRQKMHHIALQQSDYLRAKFMAEISTYDPTMLVWLDETGCDNQNALRKKA